MREIEDFNPVVHVFKESHKKYLDKFETGNNYPEKGLGDYIKNDALDDKASGDGVSYIVLQQNKDGEIVDAIAFYTLVSSVIPCIYNFKTDEDGAYDTLFEIPAVRIQMFALNQKYQDSLYEKELIASRVFKSIITQIDEMASEVMGIKAIYLYTIPSAKKFYKKNNFLEAERYMVKLASGDEDCDLMYAFIREVHITYEATDSKETILKRIWKNFRKNK